MANRQHVVLEQYYDRLTTGAAAGALHFGFLAFDFCFSTVMSFQGLISGSECATSSNPLSQVLKHTEGDRSLQQVSSHTPKNTGALI